MVWSGGFPARARGSAEWLRGLIGLRGYLIFSNPEPDCRNGDAGARRGPWRGDSAARSVRPCAGDDRRTSTQTEGAMLSAATRSNHQGSERQSAPATLQIGWKRWPPMLIRLRYSMMWPVSGAFTLPTGRDRCLSVPERSRAAPLSGECRTEPPRSA